MDYDQTRDDVIRDNPIEEEVRRHGIDLKGPEHRMVGLCPFHKEKTPSFTVDARKGVFHCFGCRTSGSVIDFVSKIENITIGQAMRKLSGDPDWMNSKKNPESKTKPQVNIKKPSPSDVAPSESKPVLAPGERPKIETIYQYHDETGAEVYQVVRLIPKSFRQRHKNPNFDPNKPKSKENSMWIWSMEGVRRVPYRLPRVMKSKFVWIVEGEKDADNLEKLGFTATCNVGGGGKWLDAYAEFLRDKEVVVCGDNDEPGEKHVEQVINSLAGKVKTLRVVRVPKGSGEKPNKDISDFIAGLDGEIDQMAEKVFMLAYDVPVVERGIRSRIKTMREMEHDYRLFLKDSQNSLLDLGKWLPSLGREVRPLVPGEVVCIIADTGVGKTIVLQQIAIAAAPIKTLLFELELPGTLTFERFAAMAVKTASKNVFNAYNAGSSVPWAESKLLDHISVSDKANVTVDELTSMIIEAELKLGEKPKLVEVDYVQLVKGKGSSRYERTSTVAEDLKTMAKDTGTIVVFTSQVTRKGEDPEVSLHDAKDSGAIENSSGLVLGVWRDVEDPSIMYIKVLKNTKGKSGYIIKCRIEGETGTIRELSPISDEDIPR